MLTKEALALRVLDLEHENELLRKDMRYIHSLIYGIGGPLNDNILKFNNKQLQVFFRIADYLR